MYFILHYKFVKSFQLLLFFSKFFFFGDLGSYFLILFSVNLSESEIITFKASLSTVFFNTSFFANSLLDFLISNNSFSKEAFNEFVIPRKQYKLYRVVNNAKNIKKTVKQAII